MPINKNKLLRIRILDYLFKNKRLTIEELMEEISDRIYESTGEEIAISERTLRDDIKLMRAEPPAGFGAPIKVQDGRYFYSDKDFGIFQGLTQEEQEALLQMKDLINRLPADEVPSLSVVERLINRLEIAGTDYPIPFPMLILDSNPHVKGLQWLDDIYEAIEFQQKLLIDYDSFLGDGDFEGLVLPYFIREYNNRWFLIGKYEGDPEAEFYTIPLDRIKKIQVTDEIFLDEGEKEKILTEFENIIGVTLIDENPVEDIILEFRKPANHYVITKPLHHSQEILEDSDQLTEIKIRVRQNYELKREILEYVPNVRVIAPVSLRQEIKEMLREGLKFMDEI